MADGEPCASRGARTVREGASTRRLPHDLYNNSITKGNSPSYGQSFQKLGKELMTVDELAVMDGGKCILQLRGVRPFFSNKYDITKHKNYKHLSDYDKRNAFNVERYLSTRLRVRPEDEFEVYDIDLAEVTG